MYFVNYTMTATLNAYLPAKYHDFTLREVSGDNNSTVHFLGYTVYSYMYVHYSTV